MIRNVVFDMGGVLIRYDFSKYCTRYAPDPDDHALIMDELFGSTEWVQLDRGSIEQGQAIRSICSRLPERLHGAVGEILNNWHAGATPIEGMDALVRRIKTAGYGVYLLSNAAKTVHAYAPNLPGTTVLTGCSSPLTGTCSSRRWPFIVPSAMSFGSTPQSVYSSMI